MELALVSLGDHLPDAATGRRSTQHEKLRLVVEHAVRAEQAGFHAVMLGEHHFCDYIISSPALLLAAIAERTSRLRLNTGLSLLPTQDPVRLAEDFCTLDQLSGGRAELTVGRGILAGPYLANGVPLEASRDRFAENLELLVQLLERDAVTWTGASRPPLDGVRIEPRPLQQPRFPVWVGAGTSTGPVDQAARLGLGLVLPGVLAPLAAHVPVARRFHEQWAAAGHAAPAPLGNVFHVHVARTSQEAHRRWRPYYESYLRWFDSIWDGERLFEAKVRPERLDVDRVLATTAICGSPAEVAERLAQAREVQGLQLAGLALDLGGLPEPLLFDAIDLVGSEVLPALTAPLALNTPARR